MEGTEPQVTEAWVAPPLSCLAQRATQTPQSRTSHLLLSCYWFAKGAPPGASLAQTRFEERCTSMHSYACVPRKARGPCPRRCALLAFICSHEKMARLKYKMLLLGLARRPPSVCCLSRLCRHT